jgi:hypothetical protein
MPKGQRQPLSESDWTIIVETLWDAAFSTVDDTHRRHRLDVLSQRCIQFRDDLREAREKAEAWRKQSAQLDEKSKVRAIQSEKESREKFFSQHDPDETGPWVIWTPSQNFDNGGFGGDTYVGVEAGPWKAAAERAWKAARGMIGEPRVEKAK